ncbi:MAG TPA: hypothetical protein PKN87_06710 [Syntrophomonadaceae bacterium]|nr:hypothetical protein [Syntrophomonadaceae bacterium]
MAVKVQSRIAIIVQMRTDQAGVLSSGSVKTRRTIRIDQLLLA